MWSYIYVFLVAAFSYALIHVFFWLSSESFTPSQSLFAFLRSAPSATATPLFQSVDLARGIALATGGATTLKYWIWVIEGLLMASSAALAHFGASVRRLKT